MSLKLKTGEYLRIKKGSVTQNGFEYYKFASEEERKKYTSDELDATMSSHTPTPYSLQVMMPIDFTKKIESETSLIDSMQTLAYAYLKNLLVKKITIQEQDTYPYKDAEDC